MSKITVLKNKEDFKLCPKGTKLKVWISDCSYTNFDINEIIGNVKNERNIENCLMVEVDFSSIEPLYPHKGLKVPKEGIHFANGKGVLLDCADNRFYYIFENMVHSCSYYFSLFGKFELKQTMPETIEVDSPDTKRESGFYWVVLGGSERVAEYDSSERMFYVGKYAFGLHTNNLSSIDWDNPITKGAK